ncbi:MAG TPA: glycoside hydrolase family 15 protein [Gaiellaceae bacterium]|jgi:GH15 family glucan-1,4-alpha-glucosidase|nr:glycoside hydrolase family 15 protein [Gaiellaceae bacterium]
MAAQPLRVDGYAPISDYGVIGDGQVAALVARDGSVDWLCVPRFDASSVFAALLDAERGGRFSLEPDGAYESEQRYVPETNVLETTFTTSGGTVRVVDALNLEQGRPLPWRELARRVEGVSGRVPMRWRVEPRFGYGLEEPTFERLGGIVTAVCSEHRLALHAFDAGDVEFSRTAAEGAFVAAEGESALLVLGYTNDDPVPCLTRERVEQRLDATIEYWRARWAKVRYDGEFDEAVRRSALALELLADVETGALVAAATMGLPERIGGGRNFDYRYVWIRDGTFTVDALLELDLDAISHRAFAWMLSATKHTHPRLQPIYTLGGVPRPPDEQLPLGGYRGSRPVTLGNGAAHQLQLGNFGDMLEAAWHYTRRGNALDPETGIRLAEIATLVCDIWRNDDSGIWELKGNQRPYTTSKIACWATLNRALQLSEAGQIPAKGRERWLTERDQIRAFVEERCWSERRGAYAFYAGTSDLDASVLLAPRMEFCEAADERFLATLDVVLEELSEGPLVWRYSGMREEEGSFLACAFWVVEALANAGRVDEAGERMRDLMELGGPAGLYSEEAAADGTLLGNLPQALTHLSLVNAANALAKAKPRRRRRASATRAGSR